MLPRKNIRANMLSFSKVSWKLILFLVLLGVILRIISLYSHDIWFDEAISYFIARNDFSNLVNAIFSLDNQPPLYPVILHLMIFIFGNSPVSLRAPSLLFGVIAMIINYFLIKDLFNQKIAIYALTLFAFSPLLIYFSSEARVYSLFTLLTSISFFLFLKLLKKPSKKIAILFMLAFLASLYCHYYSLLLIFPFFYLILKQPQKRQLGRFVSIAIPLTLALPLVKLYLSYPHPPPTTVTTLLGLPATFLSFIIGGTGNVSLRIYFFPASPMFAKSLFAFTVLFIFAIFIKGLYQAWNCHSGKTVVSIIFLPIIAVSLTNLFIPVYSVRSFIFLAPFFYILLALGINSLPKRMHLTMLGIVCFLFISVFITTFFNPLFRGPNFKKIAQSIDPNLVILHSSVLTYYPFEYYKEGRNILMTTNPLGKTATDIIGTKTQTNLPNQERIAFVEIDAGADKQEVSALKLKLKKTYQFECHNRLFPMDIYYFGEDFRSLGNCFFN